MKNTATYDIELMKPAHVGQAAFMDECLFPYSFYHDYEFNRMITRDKRIIPLVAMNGKTLVGFHVILVGKATVHGIRTVVTPFMRRKGVGRAFLDYMSKVAHKKPTAYLLHDNLDDAAPFQANQDFLRACGYKLSKVVQQGACSRMFLFKRGSILS